MLASGAFAQEGAEAAVELVPGSVISWTTPGTGVGGNFTNIVIATGPDFTIFYDPESADYDREEDDIFEYGVEFSGIVYFGCDDILPTQEERAQIATLKHMEAGAVVTLDPSGLIVKVGKRSTSYINGLGDVDLRDYEISYDGDTDIELATSAENIPLTVKSEWIGQDSDMSVVVGVSVAKKAKPLSLRHSSGLGFCSGLLGDD